MHPARSLILFTALSGLGFGLLVFLGLGVPSVSGWLAVIYFALAFGLSAAGLVASTFHLGHPERALKAFTQWRSSWLSREAWLASATLVLGAVYAAGIVFFGTKLTLLGWLVSAMSVTTVYATSMIYAQLKTVPRWNHWSTSVIFLGLSLAGGAILTGAIWVALVLLAATAGLQFYAWRLGDQALAQSGSDIASATGLGHIGKVRGAQACPETADDRFSACLCAARAAADAAVFACLCGLGRGQSLGGRFHSALALFRRGRACRGALLRAALTQNLVNPIRDSTYPRTARPKPIAAR
jgi:hypothetical protein